MVYLIILFQSDGTAANCVTDYLNKALNIFIPYIKTTAVQTQSLLRTSGWPKMCRIPTPSRVYRFFHIWLPQCFYWWQQQ